MFGFDPREDLRSYRKESEMIVPAAMFAEGLASDVPDVYQDAVTGRIHRSAVSLYERCAKGELCVMMCRHAVFVMHTEERLLRIAMSSEDDPVVDVPLEMVKATTIESAYGMN
jgi:hypothetical protein